MEDLKVPSVVKKPRKSECGDIGEVVEMIKKAKKPFIYAGGGVVAAGAQKEVLELSKRVDAAIGLSMMGITAVPASYPLNLGMCGMHGKYPSIKAQSECDLLLAVGVRFSDRATGDLNEYTKKCMTVHIDIDRAEIGKNVSPDVSLWGDVKEILTKILEELPEGEQATIVATGPLTNIALLLRIFPEVKEKIQSYQDKSDIPLIIGADEEGGTVVRVSSNPNLAPEKFKSPQEIYNEGGMDAVVENATEKSELLLSLGVNMNLAPVADVSTNPSDYMYDRSLGQNAEVTADFVSKTVTAMNNAGIMSVLKHFPGYGGVGGDSHQGTVYDDKTAESIRENDLLPFKAGIEAGASSVLVAHNTVNALDSENPASLSPTIHNMLRDECGFDGVIMTDDIAMGAVADMENVYVKAVNAGNDLLITTDYQTGYNQILNAVKCGEISEETLNSAVERVLKMKGQI